MNNFIETPDFIKNLNEWLFKADHKSANYIYVNRSKIPSFFRKNSNYLYIGLYGIQELFTFKTGFVRLDGILSFTEDKNIALAFISDNSKFKFRNSNGIKILVKKRFSHIVFDIHKFYLFYGEDRLMKMGVDEMNIDSMIKESEVLIKDAKIYSNDFQIIK